MKKDNIILAESDAIAMAGCPLRFGHGMPYLGGMSSRLLKFRTPMRLGGISLLVSCSLLFEASATELLQSFSGTTLISPPDSVDIGELESDTLAATFLESENVRLASEVQVDLLGPGSVNSFGSTDSALAIAAGTRVTSYLVHADKVGELSSASYAIQLEFARPVLGVIGSQRLLDQSDGQLGSSTIMYPATGTGRGCDSGEDRLSVSEDGLQVELMLATDRAADQVRIVVSATD